MTEQTMMGPTSRQFVIVQTPKIGIILVSKLTIAPTKSDNLYEEGFGKKYNPPVKRIFEMGGTLKFIGESEMIFLNWATESNWKNYFTIGYNSNNFNDENGNYLLEDCLVLSSNRNFDGLEVSWISKKAPEYKTKYVLPPLLSLFDFIEMDKKGSKKYTDGVTYEVLEDQKEFKEITKKYSEKEKKITGQFSFFDESILEDAKKKEAAALKEIEAKMLKKIKEANQPKVGFLDAVESKYFSKEYMMDLYRKWQEDQIMKNLVGSQISKSLIKEEDKPKRNKILDAGNIKRKIIIPNEE